VRAGVDRGCDPQRIWGGQPGQQQRHPVIEGADLDPGLGQRIGVGLFGGLRHGTHHDPLQGPGEPGDRLARVRGRFRQRPLLHLSALLISQRDHRLTEPLRLQRMQHPHRQRRDRLR
jgi:hypothetical protein